MVESRWEARGRPDNPFGPFTHLFGPWWPTLDLDQSVTVRALCILKQKLTSQKLLCR